MSNWLGHLIGRDVAPSDTVLDLGCGILQATDRLGSCHLAVDCFDAYLDKIKGSGPTLKWNLRDVALGLPFPRRSYDHVLLLDVLEHLGEHYHACLLGEAEAIARKRVVVFSPDGMMPQEAWDAWGLGHNPLQAHVSAVHADAFRQRGYEVSIHSTKNDAGVEAQAFLAIKNV